MDRKAGNDIALEINARYKIPSAEFIKKAKEHGVKFTLGTNNGANDLGYLEYSLQMIGECGLEPDDFWKP
jgi:histidinol phosphatase-like PHP family hydrolase